MFTVILITLCGVAVGYLLRNLHWLRHVNITITLTICVMLFVLGISVGENPLIVKHFAHLGGVALAITIAAMLGSAIGGWLVWRYVFKGKEEKA